MHKVIRTLRWINLLLILTTFLAYLSPYVNPRTFWVFSFFGMAYPWLLLCNVLFVLFWGFKKDRYFLFSLFCIIMGWGHFTRFVGISVEGTAASSAISVMSYNLHQLSGLRKGTKKEQTKRGLDFEQFFQDQKPQLLCVQEVGQANILPLKDRLKMPHHHSIKGKGTAIYSVYPFITQGEVDFGTKTNSCLWADVKIGESTVRIYSVHLQSNRVSTLADQVIQEGDLQERETWSDIKGMISKVKQAAKVRAQQAELLAMHIKKCPHPVIVCGDFNDTPQSYTYRLIADQLHDGFCQKGSGIGTTYAGSIPALRIDFILHDPSIQIWQHKILRVPFSDHYPVISKLQL